MQDLFNSRARSKVRDYGTAYVVQRPMRDSRKPSVQALFGPAPAGETAALGKQIAPCTVGGLMIARRHRSTHGCGLFCACAWQLNI
jgi:hypothetical protein